MKRIARLTTLLGILAVVAAGSLAGASTAAVTGPTGLHGFMLTSTESTSTFHNTPSFAWNPTAGAVRYELQISTSATFRDNGILADISNLRTPVGAPTVTLPWITGSSHSLYARVRSFLASGRVSPWSADYGFDVVPPAAPIALSSASGMLRWSIVNGANAYEVWLLDKGDSNSVELTRTNVVDERDFYNNSNATWPATVRWRVRALRTDVFGAINRMPAGAYGPWSPTYTAINTAPTTGAITLGSTVSDNLSTGSSVVAAHQLMPGFTWSGSQTLDGGTAQFYRVYVFTDAQCVNPVFVGRAVQSQAYAPRIGKEYLPDNAQNIFVDQNNGGLNAGADGNQLKTNEDAGAAKPALGSLKIGQLDTNPFIGPAADLWDNNWPSGGYYWTVVGVGEIADATFVDTELPQDACAAGRVQRFGVLSEPTTTGNNGAYATGLSASGKLVSAAHTSKFYGEPLVAWTAALGAGDYEVQWSHTVYPFAPRGLKYTFSTSAVLPLKPGTWYYRVRGIDFNLPRFLQTDPVSTQAMAWSQPIKIVITAPSFRLAAWRR